MPTEQAVELPDAVSTELGACLGIPGITANRAVFADGPVAGRTVFVHGVLGAVGSIAAQLARWGGATVIGTVRRSGDVGTAAAREGALSIAIADPLPLDRIAEAHDRVDAGTRQRILLAIPS